MATPRKGPLALAFAGLAITSDIPYRLVGEHAEDSVAEVLGLLCAVAEAAAIVHALPQPPTKRFLVGSWRGRLQSGIPDMKIKGIAAPYIVESQRVNVLETREASRVEIIIDGDGFHDSARSRTHIHFGCERIVQGARRNCVKVNVILYNVLSKHGMSGKCARVHR